MNRLWDLGEKLCSQNCMSWADFTPRSIASGCWIIFTSFHASKSISRAPLEPGSRQQFGMREWKIDCLVRMCQAVNTREHTIIFVETTLWWKLFRTEVLTFKECSKSIQNLFASKNLPGPLALSGLWRRWWWCRRGRWWRWRRRCPCSGKEGAVGREES